MKKYFFLAIYLLIYINASSQKITSFSEDINQFSEELEVYLNSTQNDNLIRLFNKIQKRFKKKSISLTDQKNIRDVCNLMLESKMRPSPYFEEFLSVVLILSEDFSYRKKLSSWMFICENIILNSSSKQLLKYCTFTNSFLKSKKIRDSKSVQWLVDGKDFSFEEKNGTPFIRFAEKINLTCFKRNGSFSIKKTKGDYWIFNNIWKGLGGTVDWEKRGLPADSVYAHLSSYTIDVRKSEFRADSVKFFNTSLFSTPIIGEFMDKAITGTAENYYPIFKSYKKNIILFDILPDVDYMGGYTLRGEDFIADGRDNASAKIIINKDNNKILIANAARFSIKNNIIYSDASAIRIYFDNDSIYHPSLQFTYDHSQRKLSLYRDNKGISGAPIYNSYHQITIDAELLEWSLDQDNIYIGSLPVTSVSKVNFESIANYDDNLYHSLKGIDRENPLMLIRRFLEGTDNIEFSAKEFARFSGYSEVQIQHYLMNLANKGFLFYDVSSHKATVQSKFNNYVNARLKLGDYDVMSFQSNVSNVPNNTMIINSSIDLISKNLNIQGVEAVSLSDSQIVYIQPYNGEIILKKNRDFEFSGRVSAGRGRLVLYGQDFAFKYDEFKIDLTQIDSVQLAVPIMPIQRDKYGNERLVRIRTVIQAVTGDLSIDNPSNKSGLRKVDFPEYPIFRSFNDSYAYYDNPFIFEGVYNRDNFYFHLDAFEIDSLESFNGKGLRFPGIFESAGIFPTFNDTLTMMDDYSLGFITETPKGGYDLYGGKARYNNYISLSNEGLNGNGDLEYLTSITSSNEIYFFPDSTALFSQQFLLNEVQEGIEFPAVNNSETFALYTPYNDKLKIHKIEKDFDFYNSQAIFNGDILLRPTGLIGKGTMILDNSEMRSDIFSYNASWFAADTADLTVFTDSKKISFESKNLKTHIDLKDRTGDFFSNGKDSYVILPSNQYICYIDKLNWQMDNQMLILGDSTVSSKGSRFISTHPDQDSLSFIAKTSTYNLRENIINVFNVANIFVADAIIYPGQEGFFIQEDAFIPTIKDSRILADTIIAHEFTNVDINILGKKKYTASGDYTYIDALGEKQSIFFKDISTNQDNETIAIAEIEDNKFFKISSKFDFKGSIILFAENQFLLFSGYFKVNNKCDLFDEEWVSFESEINPELITFKLDDVLKNEEGDKLATGILMNLDPAHIYTSFFSEKERGIDVEIIKGDRYLNYDHQTNSFIVSGDDSLSNIFSINENTCESRSEGYIDLNLDFGQLKVSSLGFVNRNERNNTTDFQTFLLLDFMFSKEALSIMSENIYEAYGDVDFEYCKNYNKNLSRLVGTSRAEELMIDVEALDEFNDFPEELNKTLCFTDINLVWSDKHEAYINKGKIGLGNIYDKQINTVMDGYIRLSKKNGKDVLNILLKTSFGDIYFFEYKNNEMFSYSTNEDFNQILIDTKAKKRRADEKKGKVPYRYLYCSEEKMEDFEREMFNLK